MSTNSQYTTTDITVEDYLYGCVGFEVAESAIATILVDRGVEAGSSVLALDISISSYAIPSKNPTICSLIFTFARLTLCAADSY